MKFFKMSYLIAIILCMVIIDCSPSAYKDSKIIGKWTGYVQLSNGAIQWVILEDNRIKIDVAGQLTFLGKLENGVLTIERPGGDKLIFKKVNKNR